MDALQLTECRSAGREGDQSDTRVLLVEGRGLPSEEHGAVKAGRSQKDTVTTLHVVGPGGEQVTNLL